MARAVIVSEDAERDLDDLFGYIARHDSPENAARVVARIDRAIESLSTSPERGVVPAEIAAAVRGEIREIFFKPYRIVYKVLPREVLVLVVADGRRDMSTLFQRRLLSE